MIFVNFKTYKESSGKNAVSLAHTICGVADQSDIEIISCPQAIDIREVVETSNHPVWAQHLDAEERGRATGWLPAEIAKETGAEGTLLNHSEHKLSVGQLGEILSRCKGVGLKSLVFADSLDEAKVIAKFQPDYIGYEPPEFVGSRTISVATAKPEIIEAVVEAVMPIPVIAGAGVHSKEDVKVSLKLGAVGVAVATDIILTKDHERELKGLVEGFK